MVGSGTVQADAGTGQNSGHFEIVIIPIPPTPSNRIELKNRSNSFRQMLTFTSDASAGLSARGLVPRDADPDIVIDDATVDASSEGTTQAVEAAGLENVSDQDLDDLGLQTSTDTRADYTGLSDAAAASAAAQIAFDLFTVAPIALATNPDGSYGYVLTSAKALFVIADDGAGGFSTIQFLRDGVDGFSCLNGATAMIVSADGKSLYVSPQPQAGLAE